MPIELKEFEGSKPKNVPSIKPKKKKDKNKDKNKNKNTK